MDQLDARERAILALRYGLGAEGPLTFKEIGRRLGVTGERVCKIKLRAVRKLAMTPVAGPMRALAPCHWPPSSVPSRRGSFEGVAGSVGTT
jgi:RNA polymerase primary sigma factor